MNTIDYDSPIIEAIRRITLEMYKKYNSKELELKLEEDQYLVFCKESNIDSKLDFFETKGINGINLKISRK